MLWLYCQFCHSNSRWQQAVLGVVIAILAVNTQCCANSIGIGKTNTLVDFGDVSPEFSPYLFPLAAQLVVTSPEFPWFLQTVSDTHFRDGAGNGIILSEYLEWRVHAPDEFDDWHSFGPMPQVVVESSVPTILSGEVIGIDYRLNVPWNLPPTSEPVTLDVEYIVGPTADLYTSYVSPNPYVFSDNQGLEFGFYLPEAGIQTVLLKVIDSLGTVVYQKGLDLEGEKWQKISWSGYTLQGFPVDPGQYSYEISAKGILVGAGTLLVDSLTYGVGSIVGAVRDAETLEPLSLAVVKLYNSRHRLVNTIKTDENGGFRFGWLPVDRYFLHVSCPGYYPEETAWFTLGSGQAIQQNIHLVHNNSLVVQEFQVPKEWPVGQLGEISFSIANPGTADVVNAVAWLEVPSWLNLCREELWWQRGHDEASPMAPELLQKHGQRWKLHLGGLKPGESVSIRLLAYAGIVSQREEEIARLYAEGVTVNDKVTSTPVERKIHLEPGSFQIMLPPHRLIINNTWGSSDGWQLGVYVNYPSEIPLWQVEKRYLELTHGQAGIQSVDLHKTVVEPTEVGGFTGGTLEASGWIQYQDLAGLGVGEKTLTHAPIGAEQVSTAGIHGLVRADSSDIWATVGRPNSIWRREEWEIDSIIREVILEHKPVSAEGIVVYVENADGARNVIAPSKYSVSLSQRRISFFHALSPQDTSAKKLVVEYESAWRLGEGKLVAVGLETDLGWHTARLHFLQVPPRDRTIEKDIAGAPTWEVETEPSRWLTFGTEGEIPEWQLQYSASLSALAEDSISKDNDDAGRKGYSQSVWERLADQSAVKVDLAWVPYSTLTVRTESVLAGTNYQTLDRAESIQPIESGSELSFDALLTRDLSFNTEVGLNWQEGKQDSKEKFGRGKLRWTPEGLPAIEVGLERERATTWAHQSLFGEIAGELGDLTWRMWGDIGNIVKDDQSLAVNGVGFGLDYQMGGWSSVGVAYSRSHSIPKDENRKLAVNPAHSMEMRFQTTPVGPVSLYAQSNLEWNGPIENGFKRSSTNSVQRAKRIFDIGVSAALGNSFTWDTSITKSSFADDKPYASGIKMCLAWEDMAISGLKGELAYHRDWGQPVEDNSPLADFISLQPSLGESNWSERRQWSAQVEYSDPVSPFSPEVAMSVHSGKYQLNDEVLSLNLAETDLVLPLSGNTDVLVELTSQLASRGTAKVLTGEVTSGILHHLNEKWSVRGTFSRCWQNPSREKQTSVEVGVGYQVRPGITLSGGLSYLWNGKTNGDEERLRPYLQFYCGDIPFTLLE